MDDHADVMRALFDHWGWSLPRSDGRWQTVKCGVHDDTRASARVNMAEGAFICLACGTHAGTPAGLVVAVSGCSWSDAFRLLESFGYVHQDMPVRTGPRRPWKGRRRPQGSVAGWRKARA